MTQIPLQYFLIVSTIMFFTGIYGFLIWQEPDYDINVGGADIKFRKYQFSCIQQISFPDKLQGHFFSLIVVASRRSRSISYNCHYYKYLQEV